MSSLFGKSDVATSSAVVIGVVWTEVSSGVVDNVVDENEDFDVDDKDVDFAGKVVLTPWDWFSFVTAMLFTSSVELFSSPLLTVFLGSK